MRLPDNVAGDPHHHVVEAAVLEVIFDSGTTRPRDGAVDHVQLAVVGATHFVLPPVDVLVVRVEAVAVEGEHVVDDDLRPRCCELREHLPSLAIRSGAVAVHDDTHLDTLRDLPLQQPRHPHPDGAFAPAEHEDVDGRLRTFDVLEDAREEVRSLDPRLYRGRRRPREVERGIMRTRPAALGECAGRRLCARRSHRIGRGWPARLLGDPQYLPVHEDEHGHSNERGDREALASALPTTRVSVVAHCRRTLQAAAQWHLAWGGLQPSPSPSRLWVCS